MILRVIIFAIKSIMEGNVSSLRKKYSFRSNNKDKIEIVHLSGKESVCQKATVESDKVHTEDASTSVKKVNPSKNIKTPKLGKRKNPIKVTYENNEESLKKDKWEPENWNIILDNIREMRKSMDAPVDTMGCDTNLDLNLAPEVRRYHVLISLILSSQTKDEVNFGAMKKLRNHGLMVDNILNTDDDTLGKLIYPVGFWKVSNNTTICRQK